MATRRSKTGPLVQPAPRRLADILRDILAELEQPAEMVATPTLVELQNELIAERDQRIAELTQQVEEYTRQVNILLAKEDASAAEPDTYDVALRRILPQMFESFRSGLAALEQAIPTFQALVENRIIVYVEKNPRVRATITCTACGKSFPEAITFTRNGGDASYCSLECAAPLRVLE